MSSPAGVTYTEAAQKATVETISEQRADFVVHTTTVKNEYGESVLEAVSHEFNNEILLYTRYAKPGEAMKGYGTRAFIEGPMELSIRTGKPLVVDEMSSDARFFYEALERRGIASFRMTPGAKHMYSVLVGLKTNNPNSIPEATVSEYMDNITVHISGIRATAELSKLGQYGAEAYGLEPNDWLWFNRLINQSGIPRIGTLLLDKVLEYCEEKNYPIVNQVNAYGDIGQQDLENWYISKGFVPVDYEKYGNAFLKWVPRSEEERTQWL